MSTKLDPVAFSLSRFAPVLARTPFSASCCMADSRWGTMNVFLLPLSSMAKSKSRTMSSSSIGPCYGFSRLLPLAAELGALPEILPLFFWRPLSASSMGAIARADFGD